MKSFLSVDLDYWGLQERGYKKSIIRFLNKIISLNKPIQVFESHEEILPFLNTFKINHLYQIDFHSDICEDDLAMELNEGTWANFYKYKKNCIFEWRYPDTERCFNEGWGRCDSSQEDGYNAYWPSNLFPYKNVIRKQGLNYIDFNTITAIGIAVSRQWYDNRIDFVFDRYKMFEGKEFKV